MSHGYLWFIAALLFATGCTLYKSSDRDFFNSNALAGAPTPTPASKVEPPTPTCTREDTAERSASSEPVLSEDRNGTIHLKISRPVDPFSELVCDFRLTREQIGEDEFPEVLRKSQDHVSHMLREPAKSLDDDAEAPPMPLTN